MLPGHETRLVARAGRAHRHHRAQEGRGLSRVSRQARRADQALQPLVLCRRAEPPGAKAAFAVDRDHRRRSQRPEGRQRPARPRGGRRDACAAPAKCSTKVDGGARPRRAHRRRRIRDAAAGTDEAAASAMVESMRKVHRAQQPVLSGNAAQLRDRDRRPAAPASGSKRRSSARTH